MYDTIMIDGSGSSGKVLYDGNKEVSIMGSAGVDNAKRVTYILYTMYLVL